MEVIIKHPTNPNIDFVIKLENSIAANLTIEQLLKNVEEVFIKSNQANQNLDYANYWKLKSCKSDKCINNTLTCDEIDTGDNKFTICWGTGK